MSLPASSALPNLTGIPGGINESIPLQVRTPEPIDLLGQQSRAYTLASQVGAVQDEQQLRADRQSITDYLQQGGELETPDGVDAAIRTLKGKLSVPTYQKLLAGKDQAYNRVLEAAKSKANLTSTEIDQQEKQFSLLGMGLQRAEIQRKAAVDAALASGLDQTAANNQALEAFNSSKQAYAETMRASKVPDTVIDEFLAIPPAQVPNVIGATKFGQAALKAASEAQFKSAEAYRNIAQGKDYEAKSKVQERIASGAIMPKAETFVDATGKSYLVDRTTQSALVSTDSGQMVSIPWADVPWKSLSKVGSANTPAGAISDETIDYYARQSLAGDNSWQIGLARGKVGQALIAAVKDRIPQLAKESQIAPEEASTTKDERLALSAALKDRTKFLATSEQFVNNFEKQIKLVEKYLSAGVGGETPIFNKWIQSGRKGISGDPDVTNFDTVLRGLAREHQRIVTGVTSNAQLHASAQATGDELLNRDETADQISGTLKVMSEEARNAKAAGEAEVGALRTKLQHLGARRQNKQPTPAGFPQITPNNAGAAQARDLSIESNQKSVEDAEIEVRELQLKIADKSTPPQNRKVFEESLGIAQRKLQGAKDSLQASQAARREVPVPQQTPFTNAKGWLLHTDAKGNRAYVSPDGKQFEEVQ